MFEAYLYSRKLVSSARALNLPNLLLFAVEIVEPAMRQEIISLELGELPEGTLKEFIREMSIPIEQPAIQPFINYLLSKCRMRYTEVIQDIDLLQRGEVPIGRILARALERAQANIIKPQE